MLLVVPVQERKLSIPKRVNRAVYATGFLRRLVNIGAGVCQKRERRAFPPDLVKPLHADNNVFCSRTGRALLSGVVINFRHDASLADQDDSSQLKTGGVGNSWVRKKQSAHPGEGRDLIPLAPSLPHEIPAPARERARIIV